LEALGPYLSERAWGTVREDYSADGDAWSYLPHDHARSRAYRFTAASEQTLAAIVAEHSSLGGYALGFEMLDNAAPVRRDHDRAGVAEAAAGFSRAPGVVLETSAAAVELGFALANTQFHHYYGDDFTIECPTGSGQYLTLRQVADELSRRLIQIFMPDPAGRRAVFGDQAIFQNDPHWRDYMLFYEYFHADSSAGLGASHQTGWTGLVAKLIPQQGEHPSGK
jgi:hypothetical protein